MGTADTGPGGGVELPAIVVVLVTGPDEETLLGIGRRLVAERLAACCNVLGGVASVYRWKGEIEQEGEALAIIKTTRDRYPALERALRDLHPYEVPEIIAVPVDRGLHDYLEWVRLCTNAS